jgi:hypothetical protein
VKFGWPFSVNMSVGGIRMNEGEIRVVIECKYVCRWDKSEIQVVIECKYVCWWNKDE